MGEAKFTLNPFCSFCCYGFRKDSGVMKWWVWALFKQYTKPHAHIQMPSVIQTRLRLVFLLWQLVMSSGQNLITDM